MFITTTVTNNKVINGHRDVIDVLGLFKKEKLGHVSAEVVIMVLADKWSVLETKRVLSCRRHVTVKMTETQQKYSRGGRHTTGGHCSWSSPAIPASLGWMLEILLHRCYGQNIWHLIANISVSWRLVSLILSCPSFLNCRPVEVLPPPSHPTFSVGDVYKKVEYASTSVSPQSLRWVCSSSETSAVIMAHSAL